MQMKIRLLSSIVILICSWVVVACVPEEDSARIIDRPVDPVDTIIPAAPVEAVFSVSDTLKVRFSPGNLQYVDGEWRFAEHQGDVLSVYNNVTCDLFRWSAENTNWGLTAEDDAAANTWKNYRAPFVDWGTNPQLIEALGEGWRTLTVEEWDYLLNKRSFNGDTGLYNSYVTAVVDGQYGLIIYPDGYTDQMKDDDKIPDSCVFLPGCGYREGSKVYDTDSKRGRYHTASPHPTTPWECMTLSFYQDNGNNRARLVSFHRITGVAVRLVRDVK